MVDRNGVPRETKETSAPTTNCQLAMLWYKSYIIQDKVQTTFIKTVLLLNETILNLYY